ncbi:integrase [Cucumis melo var. makuwa]|uniref:Integrase n=1 Tax=Cucumis melo var. makuwa TaxID=1194695 RepID=A0A5A7SPD8_CUCMM|nr:integrase [Cucumis melo var. makuwa]TYK22155.1 integrase [Cucumis melo var. makuwa]
MEMARSMLKAKNLPNEFWGDVVACTVYILNRAPTKSIPDENKVIAQELEQAEIQAVESSSSSTPSSTSDDEISPRRIRSIQETYNATNRINDGHFANFALFVGVYLVTFDEAIQDEKWKIAIDQEIDAIRRNETWELMEIPTNKQALGVKWVYITKLKSDANVEKYKARLVKGYKQEYGVDFKEIFAPITIIETIRLILSLAAQKEWKVYKMDVESAFLNGHLKEEIFVAQGLCEKRRRKIEFEMSDMGLIHYFLEIEVNQNEGEIVISQQKYAHDLLKKIRMENALPCNTPMDANLKLCKDDIGEAVDQVCIQV